MRKNFWQFTSQQLKNFGEAVINLFIFLPYFFSVSTLIKTFFFPWRNLVVKKTVPGFSLVEWANRFAFNFISRSIGVIMRLSIVSFYFIFQTSFMILLPFIALFFFLLTPIIYFLSLIQKSLDEQKQLIKEKFISTHLLKEENKNKVDDWFEKYYQQHVEKIQWWKLTNLFSIPPLARDWAVGYTPILDQYAIDLATSSYLHHIKNIVNRNQEIEEIEQVLSKSTEANVLVVGEEGVGKHTIIDALAKKIYLGKTNIHLMYRRILKLNMEKILTEFTDEKQRENFFEDLLSEASQAKNIILFIDNFDKYLNFSASLEKYAKTDALQIIGITTPFAYERFIFNNEKISRLFNKIDVYEVKEVEAEKILLEAVFNFEDYHQVYIPYETVKEVIEKSQFYLTYIPYPEKAVDLLDQTCVYKKQKPGREQKFLFPTVTPDDVDIVLTEKTHIPTTITKQMKEKLLNLETLLFSRIIQQDEAIKKLSSALRRSFLLIGKRKKPLATFLFLGPTGVGKTETAKAIAEVFFSNSPNLPNPPKYLIRFDMSEYQLKSDIPKLIGDVSTGYPGLMTQAIREHPFGVLLLDEIEKADKDLLNIFLTILDEGYFTDGAGKRVDCKNLVIIATSNAGSDLLISPISPISLINEIIKRGIFSPEFLNRFDGVIVYQPLAKQSLLAIAKKMIDKISKDIYSLYKVYLKVNDVSINQLIDTAYDPRFGARNLERVIRDEIEDKVAKIIFSGKAKPEETIDL